jgi:hypothetical protein
MATSITGIKLMRPHASECAFRVVETAVSPGRRRKIAPEAGRAIEMLGHAIEYLADEFALDCMSREPAVAGVHPRVVAIEILKKCNRVVYAGCPEVPTLGERLRGWFRGQRA